MLAGMSLGTDLKRFSRGALPPRIALVTVILMPLLYGAMYLWAFWNPFAEVNKIPVALVNEDTGTVVDGQQVRAGGAEVADALVDSGQLQLHRVSSTEAAAGGVSSGKYYFSVTLPENFSADVAPHPAARPSRRRSSSSSTTPTTIWVRSSGRTPPAKSSTRSTRASGSAPWAPC